MFKFNFSQKNDKDNLPTEVTENTLEWLPAEHVSIDGDYKIDEESLHIYKCGHLTLKYHDMDTTVQRAISSRNSIAVAEQSQSDLLPSKYEGGLKIWECTYDLAEYLLKEFSIASLSGCNVLDVGCGAGLVGIVALKLGAHVTFQDYNKEVIETTTIPNVLVNMSPEDRKKLLSTSEHPERKRCRFYCGDWGSFVECHHISSPEPEGLFDYIVTSETIYNPANHKKLSSLFRRCLKKSGAVYLAAKTYYFGVGGGIRQFEDVIANDGVMTTNVCWKNEGGVQREILKIRFKD